MIIFSNNSKIKVELTIYDKGVRKKKRRRAGSLKTKIIIKVIEWWIEVKMDMWGQQGKVVNEKKKQTI